MDVKVPTGADCAVCPVKSACTFSGPESAYRTHRVALIPGCVVGDRVWVDEPTSVLVVTLLVVVGVPVILLFAGYAINACCVRYPYGVAALWLAGIAVWVIVLYGANLWMARAAPFQVRIHRRRQALGQDLVQGQER